MSGNNEKRMVASTGYDTGHYYHSRDKALEDLHLRASKEQENTSPGKTCKLKSRDSAR